MTMMATQYSQFLKETRDIVAGRSAPKKIFLKHILKVIGKAEEYEKYLRGEWQKAKEAGLTQRDDKKDKKE